MSATADHAPSPLDPRPALASGALSLLAREAVARLVAPFRVGEPLPRGLGGGVARHGVARLPAGVPPFPGFGETAQAWLAGHVLVGAGLGLARGGRR
jgi:hypothetical protein